MKKVKISIRVLRATTSRLPMFRYELTEPADDLIGREDIPVYGKYRYLNNGEPRWYLAEWEGKSFNIEEEEGAEIYYWSWLPEIK